MKKSILTLAVCSVMFLGNANAATMLPVAKETGVSVLIKQANADGKVTFKELKGIEETIKGEKLTLKEKVVLKLNQKKVTKELTNSASSAAGSKSQLVAALLAFFLGGLGIHRYYLGYTWQGIVQTLTLGGLGIWALIDLVRILLGTLKPKDGEYDTTL